MRSSPEKKEWHPLLSIALTSLLLVGLAITTYFVINSMGHIPNMPIASITPEERNIIIEKLEEHASNFHLTGIEQQLVSQLEEIHMLETDNATEPARHLNTLIETFKVSASELAQNDQPRFLVLGDFLAARFHRALLDKLTHPQLDVGIDLRLVRFGGRFYARALKRGLITADHHLTVSPALFGVLFRFRWRLFAGLDGDTGFGRPEQILLYDFLLRFSEKKMIERRLDSISRLRALSPGFNACVAKGLVYYEAGDASKAIQTLKNGISAGDNPQAGAFLEALQ